jgi:hypothetical protein
MGSKLYDYLNESLLFDDSLIQDQFRSIPERKLLDELGRYRQFCLSAVPEIEKEISSNTSNLKLFSGIKLVRPDLLKQSAFYVEQHILYDPLFVLTSWKPPQEDKNKSAFNQLFGLPGQDASLDRKELSEVVAYLKSLTPMVAADYVKLLPTSYFFETPDQLPFRYSKNGFADVVPEQLLSFIHENAIVKSVKNVGGETIIDGSFEIGRSIYVLFKDHGIGDGMGFCLAEQKVTGVNQKDRTVSFTMYVPPTPPGKEEFDRWVYQSINQTAGHLYRRVLLENMFAAKFGASYLSKSPFIFRLLEQIVPVEGNIQTNTANALMSVELPFLEEVDIETLMKVRQEEGEAFQSFRLELDKQLRELRLVKDPEALKIKTENAVHELSEVQVHQLDQKLAYLKKRFFAESSVAAASLMGALQSGGLTLPVALIAALQGYKTQAEYQRQKRENPAFFLWKVLKGPR